MEAVTEIPVIKTKASRLAQTDFSNLEFGKNVSDHMLVCDYEKGEWLSPSIMPFGEMTISPAALGLHYGQTVFEGMKAFRNVMGQINIFRIDKHYDRFIKSLERMCMPAIPEEIFKDGLAQLLKADAGWVPEEKGTALYIRPFMYASEARFGIHVADRYRFMIITGPVGVLYTKPVKVKVETHFNRAAKGGTGAAKCGGNYGGALLPTKMAKEEGYDQVLWTDSRENKYIEESGMMNAMFVIDGVLVTPPLSDSILDGVTRDSLLAIAREENIKVEERPVSVEELKRAFETGSITEAFGAGTAAVVLPMETIGIEGTDYRLPAYNSASIMNVLKLKLDEIRYGSGEDIFEWNYMI